MIDHIAKAGLLKSGWTRRDATDWFWALISVQLYEAMRERGWSGRRYAERLKEVVASALLEEA